MIACRWSQDNSLGVSTQNQPEIVGIEQSTMRCLLQETISNEYILVCVVNRQKIPYEAKKNGKEGTCDQCGFTED